MNGKRKKLLLIDDEQPAYDLVKIGLSQYGFDVDYEKTPYEKEVLKKIKEIKPDAILLDILFNGQNEGKRLLEKISEEFSEIPVIMLTNTMGGYREEDYPHAAFSYAKDAFREPDKAFADLAKSINEIIDKEYEIKPDDRRFEFVYGDTPSMLEVCKYVLFASKSDIPVLITGETGTGKEKIANTIHKLSDRVGKPLIAVNCAAIPEKLIESELFGHERGAFTGAVSKRIGKFELANEGTIFLDEIGDISYDMQAKILRVLQEKKFQPVGGTKTIEVNVRVIAATNKNLEEKIEKGEFREDLYYRLRVLTIKLPPLRDRSDDDFKRLYFYFVEIFNKRCGKNISTSVLNDELFGLLRKYNWPGNIREFENEIGRAVTIARGNVLLPSHFEFVRKIDNTINFSDTDKIVENIWQGKLEWKDIIGEYNSKSPRRKEIIEKLIERWIKEKKENPTSNDLALKLNTSDGNMRQILLQCKIRLRESKGKKDT